VPLMAGFSLVELMISITIMVIVIAIVSTSQGAFNGAVLLRGQVYEAALQIREVQLNAVGAVRAGEELSSVHGVHFDSSPSTDNQYKVFKDTPKPGPGDNGFYDSGEEYGQQSFLDSRFEVREIRTMGSLPQEVEKLSIIFVRPNFDARFVIGPDNEAIVPRVEIDISRRGITTSGPGDVRTLEVTSTGQIAVKPIIP